MLLSVTLNSCVFSAKSSYSNFGDYYPMLQTEWCFLSPTINCCSIILFCLHCRLLTEEDEVRIYHSLENTRLYHEIEPTFIQISAEVRKGLLNRHYQSVWRGATILKSYTLRNNVIMYDKENASLDSDMKF